MESAWLVVLGYVQRWRIEQFHKIWKTGACRVEDTQLRECDRIEKWAMLKAAVAMRILRLGYLARTAPSTPATVVFTMAEIKAALALARQPRTKPRGGIHTLAEIEQAIACAGGYTGKSSGGPPGALVLARGLSRIEPVAQLVTDGVIEL